MNRERPPLLFLMIEGYDLILERLQKLKEKCINEENCKEIKDFDGLKLSLLKKVCSVLKLKNIGNRKSICFALSKYFGTSDGFANAYKCLSKEILALLFKDPDPISTYISLCKEEKDNSSMLVRPSEAELMQNKHEIRCVCIKGNYPYIKCTLCGTSQHWYCMGRNVSLDPYACIFCQMVLLDPSQVPTEVLQMPWSLYREDPKVIFKKASRTFKVTEDMIKAIQDQEKYEIQLRMHKIDGVGYNNKWPEQAQIVLNDELIFETHKSFFIDNIPLNLSKKLHLGDNTVNIYKHNEYQYYAAAVFLIKKLDYGEINKKFDENAKIMDVDEGKNYIVKYYNEENKRFNVKCQIKNRMINEPVRGVDCKHIGCFDLVNWIDFQGRKLMAGRINIERWKCPICKIRTVEVCKDEYMKAILQQANILGSIESIEFDAKGDYTFISNLKFPRKKKKTNNNECIIIE